MRRVLDHVAGQTYHGREAEGVRNAFRYGIDYVMLDPDDPGPFPRLFSRDRANLAAIRDLDHGGPPGAGRGVAWAREALAAALPELVPGRILLLAQPRVMGHAFNPVAFWLVHDSRDALRVVIAEVTNTFGDRHSYLCHAEGLAPIGPGTVTQARKLLHVSPFQPVEGGYSFRFDIGPDHVAIRIEYRAPGGRLVATLTGGRRPLTSRGLLRAALRRPFGTRRVTALIHWQAVRLWWKGATFRPRPTPPETETSR